MTGPVLVALSLTPIGAHQLRRLLDAGLRKVDRELIADDVLAFADLVRALDNGRQMTSLGASSVDDHAAVVDDAPMTFKATARRLDISARTVARMVQRGDLDSVIVGKRPRIPAAAVAAMAAGAQIRPGATSSTSGECLPASSPTGPTSTRAAVAVKAGPPSGQTSTPRSPRARRN